jgi:hypothetical protein
VGLKRIGNTGPDFSGTLKFAVFVIMHMVKSIMHTAVHDAKAVENREETLDHAADSILDCLRQSNTAISPAN